MADGSEDRKPKKKPLGGELIIPLAAIAFTLYYLSSILQSPWEAQVNAFFVGSILIAVSVVFIGISVRSIVRGEADWGFGALVQPLIMVPKRLILLVLTAGYIFALEWGGFTLTTFVFLATAMLLLTNFQRKGLVLALSLGLSLGGYLLFIVAFDTRFPQGAFERLMRTLI